MNRWFERLIEQTSLARDEISIQAVLERLSSHAGFSAYAYVSLQPETQKAYSNYAPEYQRLYLERSYSTIDPVVRDAKIRMEAFAWSMPDPVRLTGKNKEIVGESAAFGIRSGVSIPIVTGWGRLAMLTLSSEKADSIGDRILNPVLAAAAVAQVHARLAALNVHPTEQKLPHLKPDELTCLRWSAEGKSMRAIAVIENMSYGNVAFHIRNGKTALGVTTLPQATAVGTELGLI